MHALAWLVSIAVLLVACSQEREHQAPPTVERRDPAAVARERPAAAPDAEERRRRGEAVRRATEELGLRGVNTTEFLMNLGIEGDQYRVAFVRRNDSKLRAEVTVMVRQADFEILSVSGLESSGGQGREPR